MSATTIFWMILGAMFVGASIAGMAYLVGYGAGHTNGFHLGQQDQPEPITIHTNGPSAKEVAKEFVYEIDRAKACRLGHNATRAEALERM